MGFNGFTALVIISLVAATPCLSQTNFIVTDKSSPLKLIGRGDGPEVEFKGSVQLSGRFVARRQQYNEQASYLELTFYPDDKSARMIPRYHSDGPIKDLTIANSKKAGLMLFDVDTIEKVLNQEFPSATVAATATIRNYRMGVSCDQPWRSADLVLVSSRQQVAALPQENARAGC